MRSAGISCTIFNRFSLDRYDTPWFMSAPGGEALTEAPSISMNGPDTFDEASADHRQLEDTLVMRDRDGDHLETADVSEDAARLLVADLVDRDLVAPIPEKRVLVHEPSGEAFESIVQLAIYHRSWTAAYTNFVEDQ